MKRLKTLAAAMAAVLALSGAVCADDGEITNKRMSDAKDVPDELTELPALEDLTPEAEHAFTGMMGFYVPMQAADGATGDLLADDPEKDPRDYYNIDDALEETLDVAKPLVNVYIYGPAVEVHATAFAHSYMDTYGAVSLDDGQTFKVTNLSDSATESSFDLETDHVPGEEETLPADHTVDVHNEGVLHAPGYKTPYESHCVECHGVGLQGTAQVPSCYSCHDVKWPQDPAPEEIGPIVMRAILTDGTINGAGINAIGTTTVSIVDGANGDALSSAPVSNDSFTYMVNLGEETPPCSIAATYVDSKGFLVQGPAIAVVDENQEPLEACETQFTGDDDGTEGTPYPGGTYNVVHAVAGNKVLVAWPSRYCSQGQPAYSIAWDGDDEGLSEEQVLKREALESLLKVKVDKDLYLTDLFGVAGKQGSIDFADEGYPQAGVVPFGCVWTARGILLPGDDPRTEENVESSYMLWTKAERLTSGRRDPNRIEVSAQVGAGFVITWQEDPDGLRPGQGEGPGEGWSGAVAHDKTDIWYSFINWEYFDLLEDPADPAGDYIMAEDFDLLLTGRPQVYVPMAVPMRLSNNDKCQADEYGPGMTPSESKYFSYCNYDVAKNYGLQDFCADTVDVPQGPQGDLKPICVNADGLPNIANTASTRPRTALHGYDEDGDGVFDSGWVIVAAEESKGLGRYQFLPDGTPCDEDAEGASPDCTADIGKNQWYYSFDMGEPATSNTDDEPYGLVQNLVSQGNLLNQPEVYWVTGEYYPVINTSEMWDFGAYNYDMYNTEIARRSSLLAQPIKKAMNSTGRLLAIPSWKQGQMRQGGPADVMLRRIVLSAEDCGLPQPPTTGLVPYCKVLPNGKESTNFVAPESLDAILAANPAYYAGYCASDLGCDDYEQSIEDNPYAFDNVVCENWLVAAGTNPYYPGGICGDPATNLSAVIPDTCLDDSGEGEDDCPTVTFGDSTFGVGDTNPILQGYEQQNGNTTRVLTWHQCPSEGVAMSEYSNMTPVPCSAEERPDEFMNLRDQSWYNPLDVAKGHRGYIDGDFVMYLYAWSPTWRLNAKGSDRYDLYVRRSFDGGATWTTTPSSFVAGDGQTYSVGDGTVTCETYRSTTTQAEGDRNDPQVCYEFGAGVAEHARNITQHKSMKTTTLDPRFAPTYTPTWAGIAANCVDKLGLDDEGEWTCDDVSDMDSDLRNPTRFFMVFETGDNTTVQEGEAEPLDLFYSRAENFGDDFVVWTETDTGYVNPDEVCYPTVPYDVLETDDVRIGSGFCNEFDRMNRGGDSHSSEASLVANPDGSKMYGVWAEWEFADDDDYESEITASDAQARRIWWIDDYISETESYTLPGVNSDNP